MQNIIVWDYIIEADKKILEKFNQMLKNVKQVRPEQVYYLNSSQRKYIDGLLADCYEMLKEMSLVEFIITAYLKMVLIF